MLKTFEAIYDGEVLRPVESLDLEPNTRVQITVKESKQTKSFFEVARSLKLDGPPDFASRLDEYLYGNLKGRQ